MLLLRSGSAQIHITESPGLQGVLTLKITGVLSQRSFDVFSWPMARAIDGAPAVVVRLDMVVTMNIAPPSLDAQMLGMYKPPPKAVVVPVRLLCSWEVHAYEMAGHGIRRAIFSPDQLTLAYLWAELEAADRPPGLPWSSTEPAPLESR